MNDSWVALLPLIFLLFVWVIIRSVRRSRKSGINTPQEATRFALENFSSLGMKDWQNLERQCLKARDMDEKTLIYSLRVASIVPSVTTLKTLLSRHRTIFLGDDRLLGIELARHSPNFGAVKGFLDSLFRTKFLELAPIELRKKRRKEAEEKVRKTAIDLNLMDEARHLIEHPDQPLPGSMSPAMISDSAKPPILIRTYKGKKEAATAEFSREAAILAAQGYYPTTQTWVDGSYSTGDFVKAFLLCWLLIGFIFLIYLLIVKPPGTLTVTYALREQQATPTLPQSQAAPEPPAPPHPRYFCFLNEQVIGPFALPALRQMTLPADTPICLEGSESWTRYGDV